MAKLIGVSEAAKQLNICVSLTRSLCQSGRIRAAKVGKVWAIAPEDLKKFRETKVYKKMKQTTVDRLRSHGL